MRSSRKNKTTALPLSKRQKRINQFNKENSLDGRLRAQEFERHLTYKGKYPKYE